MSGAESIQPQGEKVRKALKWLSEMQQTHPEKSRRDILRQAEIRFNLSPKESEFLETNFASSEPA